MTRCLDCSALTRRGSRCPACARVYELARSARRGPSGWDRQRANAQVLRRDSGRCVLCGALAFEVDHAVPLAQGGSDRPENKRSLCNPCHQRVTREQFASAKREG